MTTKKDAASAWSVRPIHPLMKTTSNPYSETTGSAGEKTAFSQDLPLSTGHSDPFLFLGLFVVVHADTPAGQQAFSLYHIALPDSASIVSYNKEKL